MSRSLGSLLLVVGSLLVWPSPVPGQPRLRTEATALLFSPDGMTLYSAALDGTIRTHDATTGAERKRIDAHKDGTYALALSADGQLLASAGGDGVVRLWDAATLKPRRALEGHKQEVFAVALSPDGKMIASGGADKHVRLWDLATGKLLRLFTAHELSVTGLAFAPAGSSPVLASAGSARATVPGFFVGAVHSDQIRLWDPATGKELRKLDVRGTAVAFAPDGEMVAAGGGYIHGMQLPGGGMRFDGGHRVGVAVAGKERLLIKGQGGALALSLDGKFLATAWGSRLLHQGQFGVENETRHRRVALWELASGTEVLQLPLDMATVVAISPDSKRIAAGRLDGSVVVQLLLPGGWDAGKRLDDLTAMEFERHWEALAGKEPAAAYSALWALASAGDRAAGHLKQRLEPVAPAGKQVQQLVNNLDSKRFAVREAAFRELKKLGGRIEPELRQALKGQLSPEVRARIESLLAPFERHPGTPEELRQTRAVQVLERIGSAEARAVLRRLAEGSPGAWLTNEARAALARAEKRAPQAP
ncbi:MAG: WD40 repeat domain-containing protein [Gemmataceae bacterium]|nr:WD40 repeat domain-containing protein [Gemmataceae bacterium]